MAERQSVAPARRIASTIGVETNLGAQQVQHAARLPLLEQLQNELQSVSDMIRNNADRVNGRDEQVHNLVAQLARAHERISELEKENQALRDHHSKSKEDDERFMQHLEKDLDETLEKNEQMTETLEKSKERNQTQSLELQGTARKLERANVSTDLVATCTPNTVMRLILIQNRVKELDTELEEKCIKLETLQGDLQDRTARYNILCKQETDHIRNFDSSLKEVQTEVYTLQSNFSYLTELLDNTYGPVLGGSIERAVKDVSDRFWPLQISMLFASCISTPPARGSTAASELLRKRPAEIEPEDSGNASQSKRNRPNGDDANVV